MTAIIISFKEQKQEVMDMRSYTFAQALATSTERTYTCTTCGIKINLERARKVEVMRNTGKITRASDNVEMNCCDECETPRL